MTELVENIIKRLPETPTKTLQWVVYNEDQVRMTEQLIDSIKGEGYCQKYCNVISRTKLNRGDPGSIYYDPGLLDHIGNGAN
jgi:hypothetical protein